MVLAPDGTHGIKRDFLQHQQMVTNYYTMRSQTVSKLEPWLEFLLARVVPGWVGLNSSWCQFKSVIISSSTKRNDLPTADGKWLLTGNRNAYWHSTRRCIQHQTGFLTARDGSYRTKPDFLPHETVHTAPNGSLPTTTLNESADWHQTWILVLARVGVSTSTNWYQFELISFRVGASSCWWNSGWYQLELVSIWIGVKNESFAVV